MNRTPERSAYDVVIVGGAIMGSSTAYFLSRRPDFRGRILVVERDPTYEFASSTHTNSCIRQQFTSPINIRVSQFAADYIRDLKASTGDPEAPHVRLDAFGYMYMAGTEAQAANLKTAQAIQAAHGAATRLLTVDDLAREFPAYNLDGVILGSHNAVDEGYFDGATLFEYWRGAARRQGVEYVHSEVASLSVRDGRVESATLASGETISCGWLVNASGPRGARTAAMAGIELPVEPRRRYSFVFSSTTRPQGPVPLTIDPSGVHFRPMGDRWLTGCPPDPDPAAAPDDFEWRASDHAIFEEKIWPGLYNRVPAFEALKVERSWIGHYAMNTLDHNAVHGPHPEIGNFMFINGFSGHGLQQSPAMGRGMAELIAAGGYETLDLTPFAYARIPANEPLLELAVI